MSLLNQYFSTERDSDLFLSTSLLLFIMDEFIDELAESSRAEGAGLERKGLSIETQIHGA